ncbi:DUF4767 domain-containing protein [Lacticaseibacillus jixianensis]|uniref:DUF4767 domain-containing protein n=1 Tax=Lacticaseibacillus jixianensis TaxID=2486012 RepID=A0ABW4B8J2_9LACO|nr:DUF4767 domain-containing protein [Lacticaseibacillus jixianensis]
MKLWQTMLAVSVGLTLAACGNQQAQRSRDSSHASSKVAAPMASSRKVKAGVTLKWDQRRGQQLAAFMKDFGPTKKQTFVAADRGTTATWQGLPLSAVYQTKQPITIDGKQTPVTWLPKLTRGSSKQPNVVAVYVDDAATVLFLFTLTGQGAPRVLISQTAPTDKIISTTETTNANVKQGFADIVAGRPVTLTSKALAASLAKAQAASAKATRKAGHAVIFDRPFQRTWYSQKGQLTITANAIQAPEYGNQPVYDIRERTASDTAALNGDATKMDPAKEDWGAADRFVQDGKHWVSVRGWYQSAGAGGFYAVTNRSLGGQTVPVLESAYGAGMWVDTNYYPTQALANQYGATIYPDENQAN